MNRMMKTFYQTGMVFFFLIVLGACGGDDDNGSTTLSLDGAGYVVITPGSLQHNSDNVAGSGSIVFNDPLSGVATKHSYALNFTLADGGSLTLVSHSSNQLANGINIVMTRSGAVLSVLIQAGGNQTDASPSFTDVDATQPIGLQIDVHNDETDQGAHLLAWTGQSFDEGDAIFNSEDTGGSPGNGSGSFWGLILQNATVNTAEVGDAKFVEP
ncbi:MAG: hypothetical protein MPW14_09330 [Candidatus Manganitrophus sp.]|nr:hypothetical protein [Candidatus Manganitrophus sp.]WDT70842.1 MAG: hypothetical protein MPW17_19160 [Candidatus Manganitrophus sp.]WDT81893.1 MAG: hypothetical protein MPW14_09330 [Candidatus Manganitrophus sp.]